MNTLAEILEYGPIVAINDEFSLLLTVNGAYFNLWSIQGDNSYKCLECYSTNLGINGLYGANMAEIIDQGNKLLQEIIYGIIGDSKDLLG